MTSSPPRLHGSPAAPAAPGGFLAALAEGRAVLAPMAGYTDAPFRRLARAYGAAWAVTEMVSSRALALGDPQGLAISAPFAGERDVVVQLFAAEPHEAAAAAVRLHEAFAPTAFDLNMGCPVRKVLHRGCGAELIRDPDRAAAIVRALVAAVPVPITVKTRLGIDRFVAVDVARAVVDAGAAVVAVHGRTAVQKYAGEADWEAIGAVAAAVDVPVLGSGDVVDAAGHARARAHGVGVMIARGALGRPWVFQQVRGGPDPSATEVAAIAWRHARDHVAWYGAERDLRRLRGQLAAYADAALRAREAEQTPEHDPRPWRDPRHVRDPWGLRDALVRVEDLDGVAVAFRDALGFDPRSGALDPLPGPSPTPPSFARFARRGRRANPQRTTGERADAARPPIAPRT